MLFKFNHLTYEVPEGAGISIEVESEVEDINGETHVHLDFNFLDEHGEHIPMLGDFDENGNQVGKSWEDYGIRKVGDDRAVADAQTQ